VVEKLKEKILTDDNLTELVNMVNEEMGLLKRDGKDRMDEVEKQLKSINEKLLKYFVAFENGTLAEGDAAPRIKELRVEQSKLEKVKEAILAECESDKPAQLDAPQVVEYVKDLKGLLDEGTFAEQKAFLRSFIKRIDYAPDKVTISYTIPMPVGKVKMAMEEVLSMEPLGEPPGTRTQDQSIKSALLYQLS
jgi:site-specific DNA recombinase